ncbi:T9SS type A sorting domain-containing protein [bacterium]|nr:T9SS type A sorting domain-containing protein [bacterium]
MRRGFLPLLLLLPFMVHAARFDVWPGGSIQNAVNTAGNGDTILVHDGMYVETVVLYGKTLTLASEFLLTGDTAHVAQTIITPDFVRQDTGSCLVYAYGEGLEGRLVGLTMQGGTGTYWAHSENYAGGALYVHLSGVTVENCRIQGSSAYRGGGIVVTYEDAVRRSRLKLVNSVIRNCYADMWGGGIFAYVCSLWVCGSIIEDDFSPLEGGGLSLGDCAVQLDSCIFQRCRSYSVAGVCCIGCNGRIADCVFRDNDGERDVNDLVVAHSWCPVVRCVFHGGSSESQSIVLIGSGEGAQRFFGNVVEGVQSLYVTGTLYAGRGYGEIAYNVFRNNVNVTGGVIYATDHTRVRIHHNVFDGNSSVFPNRGAAIRAVAFSYPWIDSNVVVNQIGPAMEFEEGTVYYLDARYNWWGDPTGPYNPTLNPGGRGDTLLQDSILFIPWLTEPPDTTMPSDLSERVRPEISTTWRLMGIYPNPFNNTVRIIIAGFARNDFRLTLHNLLGQEVDVIHAGALTGGELSYTASPTLSTGVYFLRASSRDNVETRKIVFMK